MCCLLQLLNPLNSDFWSWLDRSQSLFYFVPQDSHSQAGSASLGRATLTCKLGPWKDCGPLDGSSWSDGGDSGSVHHACTFFYFPNISFHISVCISSFGLLILGQCYRVWKFGKFELVMA